MHRFRLTVGGGKLEYDGTTKTQFSSLINLKLLLNSTISTPGARFGCFDVKNFYYGSPMTEYEYMRIAYDEIPQKIIDAYELDQLVHN